MRVPLLAVAAAFAAFGLYDLFASELLAGVSKLAAAGGLTARASGHGRVAWPLLGGAALGLALVVVPGFSGSGFAYAFALWTVGVALAAFAAFRARDGADARALDLAAWITLASAFALYIALLVAQPTHAASSRALFLAAHAVGLVGAILAARDASRRASDAGPTAA